MGAIGIAKIRAHRSELDALDCGVERPLASLGVTGQSLSHCVNLSAQRGCIEPASILDH